MQKAQVEAEANTSFNKLIELKNELSNITDDNVGSIKEQIKVWASSTPIATENDIQELSNN